MYTGIKIFFNRVGFENLKFEGCLLYAREEVEHGVGNIPLVLWKRTDNVFSSLMAEGIHSHRKQRCVGKNNKNSVSEVKKGASIREGQ